MEKGWAETSEVEGGLDDIPASAWGAGVHCFPGPLALVTWVSQAQEGLLTSASSRAAPDSTPDWGKT